MLVDIEKWCAGQSSGDRKEARNNALANRVRSAS